MGHFTHILAYHVEISGNFYAEQQERRHCQENVDHATSSFTIIQLIEVQHLLNLTTSTLVENAWQTSGSLIIQSMFLMTMMQNKHILSTNKEFSI